MKNNQSSITSLVTAFSRAYHSKNDTPLIFDDFIAKDLITEEEYSDIKNNMIQGIQFFNKDIARKFQDHPKEILKWIVQVQLSPISIARSAFCEKKLFHEIKLGLSQYVILGAGLDTFCFRYPELENNLKIFEIDYPTTQESKKKRLENAGLKILSNLHFVPMDFTDQFSYRILEEQGFKNQKTFFSLLGVSYYLSKEENLNLFSHIFSKVPSGSSIVFDYADETLFEENGMSNRVKNMVMMASKGGEPMKSKFTYNEIEIIMEKSGLLIYEHLSPTMINDIFFKNRTDYLSAFETIHYVHAVKK